MKMLFGLVLLPLAAGCCGTEVGQSAQDGGYAEAASEGGADGPSDAGIDGSPNGGVDGSSDLGADSSRDAEPVPFVTDLALNYEVYASLSGFTYVWSLRDGVLTHSGPGSDPDCKAGVPHDDLMLLQALARAVSWNTLAPSYGPGCCADPTVITLEAWVTWQGGATSTGRTTFQGLMCCGAEHLPPELFAFYTAVEHVSHELLPTCP